MMASTARFADVSRWGRSDGLELLMIVTGAMLVSRFATWLGLLLADRADRQAHVGDPLVRSEEAKHRHALIQVLRWTAIALTYLVAAVLVAQRLRLPLTTLVAPATVAAVAIGFGAQRVVQDLLGGFFIISERQYGYGDVIRVLQPGTTTGVTATVEDLTLRTTTLRTTNGEVLIVPNGDIRQVINLSRDWARSVIDVPVPPGTDLAAVSAVLRTVGAEAFADAEVGPLLLDPPSVMGVENLEVDRINIRVVARTLPGKQFEVGLALRARIAGALQAQHVAHPAPNGMTPTAVS
jgi:small conductance mechanosensitive channel